MKYDQHLITKGWEDYELLDSGDGEKLERFGDIILARPETEALWRKAKPELWSDIHARFAFGGTGTEKKGSWDLHKPVPEHWDLSFTLRSLGEEGRGPLKFSLRLAGFKHTGIFPEQEQNWIWIKDQVKRLAEGQEATRKESGPLGEAETGDPRTFSQEPAGVRPAVLNLFGYTGIATLATAHAGAFVTHVDASKQSLDWAHENARATGIPETSIRWMLDDALAFAKREVRRGAKYDGIILDPPAFGRGAKGEVWKIEEQLPELLDVLKELLSDTPGSFFLLNGYAAGYAPLSFSQAVESTFGPLEGETGELRIAESEDSRPTSPRLRRPGAVPAGIYVRFVR